MVATYVTIIGVLYIELMYIVENKLFFSYFNYIVYSTMYINSNCIVVTFNIFVTIDQKFIVPNIPRHRNPEIWSFSVRRLLSPWLHNGRV